MRRRNVPAAGLLLCAAAALCGYLWWSGGEPEAEEPGPPEIDVGAPAVAAIAPREESNAASDTLELRLKPGERFPLRKTIEQTVTQTGPDGPIHSQTTLKLLLAIRVEEVRPDGAKRMRVDYQRVEYAQDIAGERLQYDSAGPPSPVPLETAAYHGMVDNGFSFWLGPDNRIEQIDDFAGFLQRCVEDVPEAQRREVMARLMSVSGDEGIANFVDDSIGLLPADGSEIRPGAHWTRRREVLRPVPIYLTTTCILKELDEKAATIDIAGTIAPSATYGPSDQPSAGLQLTVTGGRSAGTCTIDRASGLPTRSRIQRDFDMVVHLPGGEKVEQKKRTVTTIEVYSPQGDARAAELPASAPGTRN